MTRSPLTPHKTVLLVELLHAIVVILVVVAATAVYFVSPEHSPSGLLGFTYGGAITYAGARAAQSRAALHRSTDDTDTTPEDNPG